MKNGNVFGFEKRNYDAQVTPLWLEVKETKLGGGVVDVESLPAGSQICAGVPVYLPSMGGKAVIVDAFKVLAAVDTAAVSANISPVGEAGSPLVEGMIVGKVDATGKAAKSAALGAYTPGKGFAITAGALGALSEGDYVYVIAEAGSNKAAVVPNGLSRRDIYIDTDGAKTASVAVVTKGQILEDRCPAIPEWAKAGLVGITFEKEL